ncbi:hypothetical protein BDV28DRAFT_42676 [Aspergillus coremiiformis]|uniref:Uncharacterized protein n=1 Tax=Aspergillus coremiiformis TaxID=138285 RepID=A0A5N6ZCS7_9EURO|nr:hypothetical protein BDV28DRAFT_42676 [Aspergillus coremiiformis]
MAISSEYQRRLQSSFFFAWTCTLAISRSDTYPVPAATIISCQMAVKSHRVEACDLVILLSMKGDQLLSLLLVHLKVARHVLMFCAFRTSATVTSLIPTLESFTLFPPQAGSQQWTHCVCCLTQQRRIHLLHLRAGPGGLRN